MKAKQDEATAAKVDPELLDEFAQFMVRLERRRDEIARHLRPH
jgi:hypothetical protein